MIKMPQVLEIETISYCNRKCPTCLRNSDPTPGASPWKTSGITQLDEKHIYGIVKEASELGFSGQIVLSHYNEPLYDNRLFDIARNLQDMKARKDIVFEELSLYTNADLIGPDTAEMLDKCFDKISISLYNLPLPQFLSFRGRLRTYFSSAEIEFMPPQHMVTHYSPLPTLNTLIDTYIDRPCIEPTFRLIFNHRGEVLLCCEELYPHIDLGQYPLNDIKTIMNNPTYENVINTLSSPGGRRFFPYCSTCPRP